MSVNNTKALTRGKVVIPARDGTAASMTITATDTVVTTISVPFKRSSGKGSYTVYPSIPYATGSVNIKLVLADNVPIVENAAPAATYYEAPASTIGLLYSDIA